jgi:hypothetical protein
VRFALLLAWDITIRRPLLSSIFIIYCFFKKNLSSLNNHPILSSNNEMKGGLGSGLKTFFQQARMPKRVDSMVLKTQITILKNHGG